LGGEENNLVGNIERGGMVGWGGGELSVISFTTVIEGKLKIDQAERSCNGSGKGRKRRLGSRDIWEGEEGMGNGRGGKEWVVKNPLR